MCCLRPGIRAAIAGSPAVLTVARPRASASDGGFGNGPSARTTPTIARTRHGPNGHGRRTINHREYWRGYRRRHQPYYERNREAARQRQRDRRQGCGFGSRHRVCKDGRVDAGEGRAVRHLSARAGDRGGVCKDGRVPRRNYSDLNAIGAGRGRFAKREDVIGATDERG